MQCYIKSITLPDNTVATCWVPCDIRIKTYDPLFLLPDNNTDPNDFQQYAIIDMYGWTDKATWLAGKPPIARAQKEVRKDGIETEISYPYVLTDVDTTIKAHPLFENAVVDNSDPAP